MIVDSEYFHQHVRFHSYKYEAHRLGSEKAEDSVSWNTFRSLQRIGKLSEVVRLCTGFVPQREPRLFLWGLEMKSSSVEPWGLLNAARDRFESDLPALRPQTEPDIALYEPGTYLILIEAKFTSRNPVYVRDKAKLLDLTLGQLLQIYQWPGMRLIDLAEAQRRDTIFYQLYRNLLFADWMSRHDGEQTRAYVSNLVREGYESDVCEPVLTMMTAKYRGRFEQITWEQLYRIAVEAGEQRLARYLANKTAQLKPAFKLRKSRHTP